MSEFGKGLVTCLVKFAEHAMQLRSQVSLYRELRKKDEKAIFFSDESAAQMWANGASDHLYEIEVPAGEDWNEIRERVNALKKKGLDLGHGSGLLNPPKGAAKECEHLIRETVEIAMLIDKKLGLEPDMGER